MSVKAAQRQREGRRWRKQCTPGVLRASTACCMILYMVKHRSMLCLEASLPEVSSQEKHACKKGIHARRAATSVLCRQASLTFYHCKEVSWDEEPESRPSSGGYSEGNWIMHIRLKLLCIMKPTDFESLCNSNFFVLRFFAFLIASGIMFHDLALPLQEQVWLLLMQKAEHRKHTARCVRLSPNLQRRQSRRPLSALSGVLRQEDFGPYAPAREIARRIPPLLS